MMANSDAFDAAFEEFAATVGLESAGFDVEALRSFFLDQTLPKARVAPVLTGLRDDLAAIEHERWSHWQRYMHAQCRPDPGEAGALVIPAELVKRWDRQAAAEFSQLTPQEQDSDREQVDRYLPFLIERLSA